MPPDASVSGHLHAEVAEIAHEHVGEGEGLFFRGIEREAVLVGLLRAKLHGDQNEHQHAA